MFLDSLNLLSSGLCPSHLRLDDETGNFRVVLLRQPPDEGIEVTVSVTCVVEAEEATGSLVNRKGWGVSIVVERAEAQEISPSLAVRLDTDMGQDVSDVVF